MEIKKSKEKYDVIIVGSGAAGGITTKILTDAGLKVALIEAGPYSVSYTHLTLPTTLQV